MAGIVILGDLHVSRHSQSAPFIVNVSTQSLKCRYENDSNSAWKNNEERRKTQKTEQNRAQQQQLVLPLCCKVLWSNNTSVDSEISTIYLSISLPSRFQAPTFMLSPINVVICLKGCCVLCGLPN